MRRPTQIIILALVTLLNKSVLTAVKGNTLWHISHLLLGSNPAWGRTVSEPKHQINVGVELVRVGEEIIGL